MSEYFIAFPMLRIPRLCIFAFHTDVDVLTAQSNFLSSVSPSLSSPSKSLHQLWRWCRDFPDLLLMTCLSSFLCVPKKIFDFAVISVVYSERFRFNFLTSAEQSLFNSSALKFSFVASNVKRAFDFFFSYPTIAKGFWMPQRNEKEGIKWRTYRRWFSSRRQPPALTENLFQASN